jgi:hypothetical protein
MGNAAVTIVLELDESADCPSGTATGPGGAAREFHGWLGLAEAIAALTHLAAREPGADHGLHAHTTEGATP